MQVPKSTRILATIGLFVLFSGLAYIAIGLLVGHSDAQTVLQPAPVTETSVYKCYTTARPGLPRCEKIAGATRVESELLGGSSPTEARNGHGSSANCRVVGTGPGYAIIVCG